ncbi:MAG TPA: hypothetical protein VJT72_08395 [Pseudonocardiaceae bacterium]|nr:hypothetical protein [Pseudonocardiaceae bacterium]
MRCDEVWLNLEPNAVALIIPQQLTVRHARPCPGCLGPTPYDPGVDIVASSGAPARHVLLAP